MINRLDGGLPRFLPGEDGVIAPTKDGALIRAFLGADLPRRDGVADFAQQLAEQPDGFVVINTPGYRKVTPHKRGVHRIAHRPIDP